MGHRNFDLTSDRPAFQFESLRNWTVVPWKLSGGVSSGCINVVSMAVWQTLTNHSASYGIGSSQRSEGILVTSCCLSQRSPNCSQSDQQPKQTSPNKLALGRKTVSSLKRTKSSFSSSKTSFQLCETTGYCTQIKAFSPIVSLWKVFWNSILFWFFSLGPHGWQSGGLLTQSLKDPIIHFQRNSLSSTASDEIKDCLKPPLKTTWESPAPLSSLSSPSAMILGCYCLTSKMGPQLVGDTRYSLRGMSIWLIRYNLTNNQHLIGQI